MKTPKCSLKHCLFQLILLQINIWTNWELQSVTKYLRLTLVFARKRALRERFDFYFLVGLTNFLFCQGDCTLRYHSMEFRHFPDILVYTMFVSNNRASFHLWWKGNLVKPQKVSKYYENECKLRKVLSFQLLSHSQLGHSEGTSSVALRC